jgi:hypothetical protein
MSDKNKLLKRKLDQKDIPPSKIWADYFLKKDKEVAKILQPILSYKNTNEAQK